MQRGGLHKSRPSTGMKRLLPAVLLAGVIAGLVFYRHGEPPIQARLKAPALQPLKAISPGLKGLKKMRISAAPVVRPTTAVPAPADEIARALRSGTAAERDRALTVLLPALVASDPAAAGHLALAWEPGALRDDLLREVIRLWSAADIGGAVTWLSSLLNNADRGNAATAAAAQVAQTDNAGAIELSQLLGVGTADGSLEHLTQLWTEENPREAMAWIVTQPAGPNRDRLLSRIAWVRAQSEPADAASLVQDRMSAGPVREDAIIGVVRQWAVRDPVGATNWVAQFQPGPLQTRALGELETARKLR
jgi:hypothetical protein